MDIWDNSPHTILSLLLSSTAHKFYFSEIVEYTGLARATVSSILRRLQAANIVVREEERFKYDSLFRAERVYYTLDPLAIDYLRLDTRST
jgi:DNA-binding transcriptional regulator GbsR (MarR family)